MIGTKLGAYRITEKIGEGGMASVFRAHQASMDRHVAIKVIRPHILQDRSLRDRFQREARLIARLEHPHLLPVYDFDGDHEPPFIVMRFLEGGTLKQVLARGELPHGEVLYMLRQVATALDYAHRQGVVHRDLKPSNIMIDREGNAFVTDFGIARAADGGEDLTGTGVLIGTPAYMAPEQAQGKTDVDGRADLYALGAIVFEMLTGAPPFEHDNNLGVLMAHLKEPVPSASGRNPRVPAAADEVIRRAMAKDPAGRYPTADELVAELAAALSVDAAGAPERLQSFTQTLSLDQLAAFEAQQANGDKPTSTASTPSDQQRQMTALYLDVTELAEIQYESGADTETVRGHMDRLWSRFAGLAEERGGVVQSRTDEVGVALWGRDRTSEDDAEQAIRAALRMREAVQKETRRVLGAAWEATEESPLPFAAGITTGPVLLEREAQTGTYSARGASITLAGRLREAAPPGQVLVDYDTYTQVRGVFTFQSHQAIRVRGRKEPLEAFIAVSAKPRAFRLQARGIEGVETRMIGREIELRILQEALTLTLEDGETQVVTVVGEAGIGKSRLLYEFTNWIDLLDETLWLFRARATQPSMLQPYSLTRDLFSFRFQILDSDPLESVHEKFLAGVAGFLGEGSGEKAAFLGQLVGFDFSDHPAVAAALENPEEFRDRALGYLGEFFTSATESNPVVLQIEDIHWADDRSLDLINQLVRDNTRIPLFVICMARPSLYERRPQWGEGQRFHERVQLEPLSQLSSRRLVKELLKKLSSVPPELRDLVVERADGNPFYIEELIKSLIDDRVILKAEEEWSVDTSRLAGLRVPPTLTGVLQARLDTLPPALHQILQRASVVGRIFWDRAVVFLSRDMNLRDPEIGAMLEELREREMVLRREQSSFADTAEYVFRHAILRDVTYETLVPRQRRALHAQAAEWLGKAGGERASEYTLRVAEHYAHAGEPEKAAGHLQDAAQTAAGLGAYDEAIAVLRKALDLLDDGEHREATYPVEVRLGSLLAQRGALAESRERLTRALEGARKTGDRPLQATALGELARLALWSDELDAAKTYLNEALPLTRELDDRPALMFILRQMANLHFNEPDQAEIYAVESLALARELGERSAEAAALNGIAIVHDLRDEFESSMERYGEALAIFRELAQPKWMAMVGSNMGAAFTRRGEFDQARKILDEAMKAARESRDDPMTCTLLGERGRLGIKEGRDEEARGLLRESLDLAFKIGVRPVSLLISLAVLQARTGSREEALRWFGLARAQTGIWQKLEIDRDLEECLPLVRGDLPDATVEKHMREGESLDLGQVLEGIRNEGP